MRKIERIYENPFDNLLIDLSEELVPFLKNTGHTPNIITTYSFICGITSVYYLYYKNVNLFALFFLLSYFFDCVDGHMARKYNMTTEFGDMYDHFTDIVIIIALLYVIFLRYISVITPSVILFLLIFLSFTLVHLGCQQKIYNNTKDIKFDETLDSFKILCKDNTKIQYTRFFGTGSSIIVFICIIYYLHFKLQKKNFNINY
jgi:phosphatidylglycerophosphate synthase